MKMLIYSIFIIFSLSCKGQKDNHVKVGENNYSIKASEIIQNSNKPIVEKYLTKYIDSINAATNQSELPYFLSDSQFDYKHRGIWTSLHTPISVRAQIIDRVNNCKSLLLIKDSKNLEYKKKPHIEDNLVPPLIDLSFHDLILKRMDVLGCKEE